MKRYFLSIFANKSVKGILTLTLALGIIIGIGIATKLNLSPQTIAQDEPKSAYKGGSAILGPRVCEEDAFMAVAEEVGPAVVSISTEHVQKLRSMIYRSPFGSGREDAFDQFFREFFGELPEREFKQRGLGSGVIIDKEGYILTNEHVVGDADKITVTLPDGREFEGVVRGKDTRSDLAVIKIDAHDLPVARLGDSDDVKIGQWAIAIGNPFGYAVHSPKPTITVGVVSAIDRSLPMVKGRDRDYSGLIQTDAAINPGNSGGPLVNIRGQVIGINVAIFSTTGGYQGVGFAIPVNTARYILDTLIAGKQVSYGWLGISVQNIDQKLSEYFELKDRRGALLAKILPGGPAEKAGLKEGDIVVGFDGEVITDVKELVKTVTRTQVGKKAKIDIIRDKRPMSLMVEVAQRPSTIEDMSVEAKESWRGLIVSDITDDVRKRYGISQDNGVIVTEIEDGSPAAESGIMPGDVIESINNVSIDDLNDYKRVTASITNKALIRTSRGYTVINAQKME